MNELRETNKTSVAIPTKVRGLEEGIDKSEIIMPRVKIVQKMSSESDKIKTGTIINNLTGEEMPGTFIPIVKFTQVVKFNPRDPKAPGFDSSKKPGDLLWITKDQYDPRWAESEWGENGEKPQAMKLLCFLSLFEGQSMPIVLSFANTSFKAGKKLMSLIMNFALSNKEDTFARKYGLTCYEEKNDMGAFYIYDINPAGKASQDEYSACESIYNQFFAKTKDIQVDVTDEKPIWDE